MTNPDIETTPTTLTILPDLTAALQVIQQEFQNSREALAKAASIYISAHQHIMSSYHEIEAKIQWSGFRQLVGAARQASGIAQSTWYQALKPAWFLQAAGRDPDLLIGELRPGDVYNIASAMQVEPFKPLPEEKVQEANRLLGMAEEAAEEKPRGSMEERPAGQQLRQELASHRGLMPVNFQGWLEDGNLVLKWTWGEEDSEYYEVVLHDVAPVVIRFFEARGWHIGRVD